MRVGVQAEVSVCSILRGFVGDARGDTVGRYDVVVGVRLRNVIGVYVFGGGWVTVIVVDVVRSGDDIGLVLSVGIFGFSSRVIYSSVVRDIVLVAIVFDGNSLRC